MSAKNNLAKKGGVTWAAGPAQTITRGYMKLSDAARAFRFDFRDKVVLDIGSSTGGFTKYALDHGAKKVIAIEKGTNQMTSPLRLDKRLTLHEKTDIFDIRIQNSSDRRNPEPGKARTSAGRPWQTAPWDADDPKGRQAGRTRPEVEPFCIPDTILADVSFVSLRKVLLHAKQYLSGSHTEFLVMLKPQFEAAPTQLTKGVVKNEKIRRTIIKDFESWLKNHGFLILKKRDNTLKGKTGNQERFYYLKLAK